MLLEKNYHLRFRLRSFVYMNVFNCLYLLLPVESFLSTTQILVLKRSKTIEITNETLMKRSGTVRNRIFEVLEADRGNSQFFNVGFVF